MLTQKFHIIQPVVVKKNARSPRAQVEVEGLQLELLEQDAAVAVHDRLGQAGGAGGEQHPQRVVEGHLLADELRRRRRRPGQHVVPRRARWPPARAPGRARPRAGRAARRRARRPRRGGRSPGRRSGSRRRRRARPAPAGRAGPGHRGRRSPGRRWPRPRRRSPSRPSRPRPRARWAGRRRPGRPAGPRGPRRWVATARTCRVNSSQGSSRSGRGLARRYSSAGSPGPLLPRARARRSSAARRGTSGRPASRGSSRTAVCGAEDRTSKKSQTACQNSSSSVVDHVQSVRVVGEGAAGALLREAGERRRGGSARPAPGDGVHSRSPSRTAVGGARCRPPTEPWRRQWRSASVMGNTHLPGISQGEKPHGRRTSVRDYRVKPIDSLARGLRGPAGAAGGAGGQPARPAPGHRHPEADPDPHPPHRPPARTGLAADGRRRLPARATPCSAGWSPTTTRGWSRSPPRCWTNSRQRLQWPSVLSVPRLDYMETLETNSSRTYFDGLPPRPHGFRVNMLGSASGRAYLAFCPEQELEAVLARLRLKKDPRVPAGPRRGRGPSDGGDDPAPRLRRPGAGLRRGPRPAPLGGRRRTGVDRDAGPRRRPGGGVHQPHLAPAGPVPADGGAASPRRPADRRPDGRGASPGGRASRA